MPEYLAPGVYVEEIDTGSKPIEGVSTSTAGMIGVTERGPVGVPMLTTSFGEFERVFGGLLDEGFEDHRHLPFAVDGFFTNGGKRLFVVRVLDTVGARRAAFDLHDRGTAAGIATTLLRPVREGQGIAGSPVMVLDGAAFAVVAANQPFRIGDGSTAEYRQVDTGAAATADNHVPLHLPLSHPHAAGAPVRNIVRTTTGTALALDGNVARGEREVVLTGAAGAVSALAVGEAVHIGTDPQGEYRVVRSRTEIDTTHVRVTLDSPLHLAHANAEPVNRLDLAVANVAASTLAAGARQGDSVAFVAALGAGFTNTAQLVVFDAGTDVEVRRIGDLHELALRRPLGERLPAGSVVQGVTMTDTGTARALTRAGGVGNLAIALDSRQGIAAGSVLRIGTGAAAEFVTVDVDPDAGLGGANPGTVLLRHSLRLDHPVGTQVRPQTVAVAAAPPATATLFTADADATRLVVGHGTGYATNDVVRLTTPAGAESYATLGANATDRTPGYVTLADPLAHSHAPGEPVVARNALLEVRALDRGGWGNRLRVSVEDEEIGLLAGTTLDVVVSARQIRLASYAGIQAGTVLELQDATTGAAVDGLIKVVDVNRADGTISLAADLTAAQQTAGLRVHSREFSLTVRLYRRPDPAVPTRGETVTDEETFRYLSMDPRHSRYVQTIVGATDGPVRRSDRRPEGESRLVRVCDVAHDLAEPQRTTTLRSVRPGPEALVDLLPNGRTRAARHRLEDGDDSLATITDDTYIGTDAAEPENRTGLHSLRNIDDVSIVSVPGRVSAQLQGALIDHCELMRYRFAVLDGPPPPTDTLTDVQAQRQQFDTKYAALYHPWPLIAEPFPPRLDEAPMLPVPPSGHVIGVYARTDIERGVHKAPANEVVRGILSLNRLLTKSEQDLLNPSPKNINVIRDFRPDGRGIRIWGARVITSDPDYKYVPVRRLLIFLEKSIERGLQWVVFEPNAEPLWARVRRSVSDFLRVVWRNGALEGVKEEQAFFVRCDRTTMTQTDIDNGRLICLIGVAPVKPAEFVIVRIGLKTAEAES
jgi:phage tail sheath protein FI